MTAKRRQSRRKARAASARTPDRYDTIKVSFIGQEIQRAIQRIREQADSLPREGRLAARVATTTLRLCRIRIQRAVDCDYWVLK